MSFITKIKNSYKTIIKYTIRKPIDYFSNIEDKWYNRILLNLYIALFITVAFGISLIGLSILQVLLYWLYSVPFKFYALLVLIYLAVICNDGIRNEIKRKNNYL